MPTTIDPGAIRDLDTLDVALGEGRRMLAYTGAAGVLVNAAGPDGSQASESHRILLDVPPDVTVTSAIGTIGPARFFSAPGGFNLEVSGTQVTRDALTGKVQVSFGGTVIVRAGAAAGQAGLVGVQFMALAIGNEQP